MSDQRVSGIFDSPPRSDTRKQRDCIKNNNKDVFTVF